MAYMLEYIKQGTDHATHAEAANPHEELDRYLNRDPLRESGTDVVKWWAVSQKQRQIILITNLYSV
jgi:hypothetical protein